MALSWLFACALAVSAAPVQVAAPRDPAAALAAAAALGPLASADSSRLAEVAAGLEALRAEVTSLPESVRQEVLDRARDVREEQTERRLASYEASARAAGWERGDWEEVSRLADAASPDVSARDFFEEHLADRAALERGRRAAVARRWREKIAVSDDALAAMKRLLRRGPPREDARRLEGLAGYVPGAAPRSTLGPHWALEHTGATYSAAGWAMHVGSPRGPVALAANLLPGGTFAWFKTAVHEALHQSDRGYRRAGAALSLLLGRESGEALFSALIEGYTELRTWRTMQRLLADGQAGAAGVAAEVKAAVEAEPFARAAIWGRAGSVGERMALEMAEGWDTLLETWVPHAYTPWARMAEALAREPGGQEALDALVARGDVGPLAKAVGRERLEAAAAVAGVRAELAGRGWKPGKPKDSRVDAAEAMGLNLWLVAKTSDALAGGLDSAAVVSLRLTVNVLLHELSLQARDGPGGWVDYRAMRLVDLERYRGVSDMAELRRRVREDYQDAARRRNELYNAF